MKKMFRFLCIFELLAFLVSSCGYFLDNIKTVEKVETPTGEVFVQETID